MNNKHDSVGIYSICWSQLCLLLNSTIFSTILTNCSEIGPLFMTYIQIRSWCAYIRPRNTREGKTRVRKSTLKTWNSDLFCYSVMELIGYFENGIWVSHGHLPSRKVHSKSEPHDVHMVMCMSKCCFPLFEQLLRLYLPIHACSYMSVYL